MKNVLIISFDIIREGEPDKSLSVASLLAFLKNHESYGIDFFVNHLSINMNTYDSDDNLSQIESELSNFNMDSLDAVAISCYVWSEKIINPLIKKLRTMGFSKKIILGGYQIVQSKNLPIEYPDCQIFIIGYAEQSLLDSILSIESVNKPVIYKSGININAIPSVYTTGEIEVNSNHKMVRMETKRGCPYRCSYCAHRDLRDNKVYHFPKDKVFQELAFLKDKDIKKVNIIDPVFNHGSNYMDILYEIRRINLNSVVTLQTRFENISGDKGKEFLDLCSLLNVHLEFGVQTIIKSERKAIKRINNIPMITSVMKKLNERNISYEISLIYGLPNQTVDSFKKTIEFIKVNGCDNISCYPLMLLKGTEMYRKKDEWDFREKSFSRLHIPVVVSSNTFTEDEWYLMKEILN